MPKGNPGRLKSRFEIRGELSPNEYEFQQSHGQMTEQEHENFPPGEGQEGSQSPQQRQAARIAEIEAHAHEIVERRRKKRGQSEAKGKAEKGRAAKKGGASGGAKKSAAKKSAGKSSAKKGAKKSAKKR